MAPIPLRTWLDGAPPPAGDAAGTTAVVIDVLRATTTIATALARDAAYIAPFAEIDAGFAWRAALERRGEAPLLGGERGGTKIRGYDLGNSPREYTARRVAGRPVALCTTNGTAALGRCAAARTLYAASFVNAGVTAAAVARSAAPVTLCCAGKEGAPAVEDICCAGLYAELLLGAQPYEPDDATAAALLCWRSHKKDVAALLRNCRHGRYLASLGFEEDLTFAARLDAVPVVARRDAAGHIVSTARAAV